MLYILALTLVLKIIVVLVAGPSYDLNSDDRSYLTTAQIWLDKGEFTYNDPDRPTVFITPLFPALLALLMKVIGPGLVLEQTIRVLQAVMVTVALYLVYRIGTRIFSEKVGFWGATVSAFYLPLWLVSNFILTEAVFLLLLAWLVRIALQAMERPSVGRMILFGVVWALALYARPTIALWPGLLFLLLLVWKHLPWPVLLRSGLIVALVLVLCLLPWWVRNYEVSGGEFIALTKSGGNPLLLGTFPWKLPPVEVQRTWHDTNNLWVNDASDNRWAKERIKEGFTQDTLNYLAWYTVGKFAYFWGKIYYWRTIAGIPGAVVAVMHYAIVAFGFVGVWLARRNRPALTLTLLFAYMSILHMIYLAHGRYSVPLMPFLTLFAAYSFFRWQESGFRFRKPKTVETSPKF